MLVLYYILFNFQRSFISSSSSDFLILTPCFHSVNTFLNYFLVLTSCTWSLPRSQRQDLFYHILYTKYNKNYVIMINTLKFLLIILFFLIFSIIDTLGKEYVQKTFIYTISLSSICKNINIIYIKIYF